MFASYTHKVEVRRLVGLIAVWFAAAATVTLLALVLIERPKPGTPTVRGPGALETGETPRSQIVLEGIETPDEAGILIDLRASRDALAASAAPPPRPKNEPDATPAP